MCFAFDARPPDIPADLRPIAGGAGAELLELESADGTRFSAALARVARGRGGRAVVILPDVRGLYPFYLRARRALRLRRAPRDRHRLLRPHRRGSARATRSSTTGPTSPGDAGPATVQADIAAALAALRERTGEERREHGRLLLRRHPVVPGVDGTPSSTWTASSASTAGSTRSAGASMSPIHRAREMRGPVLGAATAALTRASRPSRSRRSSGNLSEARVQYEIITYAGAPHSFFDRRFEEHARACEDAWRRVLTFLA